MDKSNASPKVEFSPIWAVPSKYCTTPAASLALTVAVIVLVPSPFKVLFPEVTTSSVKVPLFTENVVEFVNVASLSETIVAS